MPHHPSSRRGSREEETGVKVMWNIKVKHTVNDIAIKRDMNTIHIT